MFLKFSILLLCAAQFLAVSPVAYAASASLPPMEQKPDVADGYIKELRSFMAGKGYAGYKKFIVSLVDGKKYGLLDGYFRVLQKAYEDGKIDDIELQYAFSTISDLPALRYEAIFDGWVNQFPGSYVAKIAWAKYHYAVAWESRGAVSGGTSAASYAADVKDVRLNTFYREMTLAQKAYGESLKLSIKPYLSYVGLIATNGETSSTLMGAQNIDILLTRANQMDPQNFVARQQYMRFLQPQWGGSFDKMHSFVEQEAKTGLDKKKADLLRSKVYVERGNAAYRLDKNFSVADGWYRTAYQLQAPYKYLDIGKEGLLGLIHLKDETARGNTYDDELIPLLNELLDKSGYVEKEGSYHTMRGRVYAAKANKSRDSNDTKRAFESFLAGAKALDPYSLFRAGSAYCEGFPGIVERSDATCKDLMVKSSQLGIVEASILLKTKWGITSQAVKQVKEFVGLTMAGQLVPADTLPKSKESSGVMGILGGLL